MPNFKTILHPTDFSSSASEALRIACSLAREHGAKVILLHVAQRPVASVAGMPLPPPPPAMVDWSGLKKELDAVAANIKDVPVETRLVEGEPADAIVELAREADASLIVIGSHGRTGLSRLLMGSVAEHVVRKAACPVLTVKTPK
jgi:nucleotide-binding universal stress UspA family protein